MSIYVDLNSWIHRLEEWKLPLPNPKTVLITGIVGIPVLVLLHDTSDWWLQKTGTSIPILSYFQRRWKKDSGVKLADLALFRNAAILFWIACTLNDTNPKYSPLDYVADRLVNATTRKQLTTQIQQNRSRAMTAGMEALSAAAFDETKARQLRDAAIHRRAVQEGL